MSINIAIARIVSNEPIYPEEIKRINSIGGKNIRKLIPVKICYLQEVLE